MALVTMVWMRGMCSLMNANICVRMGITKDMICVATFTTVVAIVARIGATPWRSVPSCCTNGMRRGATTFTRLPRASDTGWKAGARVPETNPASVWNAVIICVVSMGGIMFESR